MPFLDNGDRIDLAKLNPGDPLVQITYGGFSGDLIQIRKLSVVKVLKTQLVLKHEATDRELRVIIRNGRLNKDEYGNSGSVWNRYSVNLYLPSDPAIQKAQERIAHGNVRNKVRKLSEIIYRNPDKFEAAQELQEALSEWIGILKTEREENEAAS